MSVDFRCEATRRQTLDFYAVGSFQVSFRCVPYRSVPFRPGLHFVGREATRSRTVDCASGRGRFLGVWSALGRITAVFDCFSEISQGLKVGEGACRRSECAGDVQ